MRDRDDIQRQPGIESERDLADRNGRVEDKYLARLADPRDDFAQKRIDDQAGRLAEVVGSTPAEIREAWHLWRSKDPQPETSAHMDPMQARLSDDKNLAFASLLARSGVERQPEAVALADENPFAAAARGAGFRRAEGNWGERPNIQPQAPEPRQEQEAAPLMRGPISPLERQVIQGAALEAIARGALDVARNRDNERPESRHDYYTRKRGELDEAQLRCVERDVEKLRTVPGLGDVKTAEREFEKADGRFRSAPDEEERAKAFTRATALSVIIDDLQRRRDEPARPLPVPSGEQPDRSSDRELPAIVPVRLGQPVRAELVPTAPARGAVPLDPANLPTQRRDEEEGTTREQRDIEPDRDAERTEPEPNLRPASDRDPGTAPGRRSAMDRDRPAEERDAATAPGRPRSMDKDRPAEERDAGTEPGRPRSMEHSVSENAPIHRIGPEGILVPARTAEVDDRQVVEEHSVSFSRNLDRDAFSLRDRERQNSEDERLGQAVSTELFCAQDLRNLDAVRDQARAVTEILRADPENADWREVARKHEVHNDEAMDRGSHTLHLVQRIALAELAMERLAAHHRLVHHITTDHIAELRDAPPAERDALKQEALVLLAIESRPGERPFEDWAFVGRELARVSDQGDDSVRVLALINAYNRHAAPSLLAEDARWEPATAERVRQLGDDLLREDPETVDARLASELATLRMTIVLDPDADAREAARERAKEVAMLAQDLPARRSLEIETR